MDNIYIVFCLWLVYAISTQETLLEDFLEISRSSIEPWCVTRSERSDFSLEYAFKRSGKYVFREKEHSPSINHHEDQHCFHHGTTIVWRYHVAIMIMYATATLWNELCDDRLTESSSAAIFKGRLKTHLFNRYFTSVSQPHSF